MGLGSNPRKLAYDVAQGFQQFNPAVLRQYQLEDLRAVYFNLNIALREIRARKVSFEDFDALKDRNMRIRRLTQAINGIQIFSKSKNIKL